MMATSATADTAIMTRTKPRRPFESAILEVPKTMAKVFPFQPYRYAPKAGDINDLVTQPYDKITPGMQKHYLLRSPYNLVRVILGERLDSDNETENVYTRASQHFRGWISEGILEKDAEPGFFAYFQEFTVPFSGEKLTRKGFIGLGAVEDYSAKVVHRHEQTLSGPKKDRRSVLEHTRAHFGQVFMLYPDPECRIDAILDQAAKTAPVTEVRDEHDTVHRLYKISHPSQIAEIQRHMSDKKLLIADGHHRYETSMAFKADHPELADAGNVMMTFVNMYSPGLRILATHRVLNNLTDFEPAKFFASAQKDFKVKKLNSIEELKGIFEKPAPEKIRIGVVTADGVHLLERERNGALDVRVLHEDILEGHLGISADDVREEKHIHYVRGIDPAVAAVGDGSAQVAFLLEPTAIQQVADTSFSGGVMPQKSTDFYPKMLTGLTIYRLEK
jgi:uncharacterized protein (DUF1015 family)